MIGEKIRHYRRMKKLSQGKLAEMVGISQDAISSYEVGRREPDLTTIYKIAEALGVKPSALTDPVDPIAEEEIRNGIEVIVGSGKSQSKVATGVEETQMPIIQQSIDRLLAQVRAAPDPMRALKKAHLAVAEEISEQEAELHQKHPAGHKVA